MKKQFKTLLGALLSASMLIFGLNAAAQSWPNRTVRLVIPFGAGGTADVTARVIAQDLSQRWGQQVLVDNKPGGDTVIAAAEVLRAAPDGYTLLMAINSTLTLTPHTLAKVPYDPVNDFTYVGQLTSVPMLLLVSDTSPAKNLNDLIDMAKARPSDLNAGGPATVTQLLLEQFARQAKIKFTWVPYKSGPDTTKALMGGEIQLAVDAVPNNLPFIQNGKFKALAVTTPSRLSTLPNVPTLLELGMKDQRVSLSHIMLAPRGMTPALLKKIQSDVQASVTSDAVKDKLLSLGVQTNWRDGVELAKSVQLESIATATLVQELGLKP